MLQAILDAIPIMLKFFFWILLLANAALFGYQQGYLDEIVSSGREPARMQNQFNADKIRVLPASAAASAPMTAPAVTPAETVAQKVDVKAEVQTCAEIGNFNAEDAQRFEARLAALALGDRVSKHRVREVLRHMVYIPPQADKESVDRKAAELRRLGVTDFYVIQDDSDMRWAISLGVFKAEEAARAQLVDLNRRGVRSARIGERALTTKAVAFRFKEWNAEIKESVEKIKAEFSKQEMRECAAI